MANVVVQAAAATPNVVKVVQAGISASNVVQSTETRGTITVNAAVDVDSSTAYTTINATNNAPTSGVIVMSLTATQTAVLKSGRYVYDLQITAADTTVTRVLEGVITIRPEVTK